MIKNSFFETLENDKIHFLKTLENDKNSFFEKKNIKWLVHYSLGKIIRICQHFYEKVEWF